MQNGRGDYSELQETGFKFLAFFLTEGGNYRWALYILKWSIPLQSLNVTSKRTKLRFIKTKSIEVIEEI